MMEQAGNNYSYNAAMSFNQICASSSIEQMAYQNRTIMSSSNPGLPQDSFRRQTKFASNRYMQEPSKVQTTMKGLGSAFSTIGLVSKMVSFFFPPAAVVSTVAEIASPVLTTFAGDSTPKAAIITTQEKYNPWVR